MWKWSILELNGRRVAQNTLEALVKYGPSKQEAILFFYFVQFLTNIQSCNGDGAVAVAVVAAVEENVPSF